jgi:nucleotide-binding universal stress UspA family protein
MFSNILVPLDRSIFAEHALPHAVAMAKRSGGTLHLVLVHTTVRPDAVPMAPVVLDRSFDEMLLSEERDYLESVARRLGAEHGVSVATAQLEGNISREISRYVRRNDIEIVTLSTHGRGGFHRAWLGSVADRLLRRLRVPVLLVRPPAAGGVPRPVNGFASVLVALDGSTVAEAALSAASRLPLLPGARCTMLRVAVAPVLTTTPYLPEGQGVDFEAMDERARQAELYLEHLARRCHEDWPTIEKDVVIVFSPAEAILERAAEVNADLIVVGSHGRGPFSRAVLGSVADKVIRGANVPVFMFPARALAWERALAGDSFVEAVAG